LGVTATAKQLDTVTAPLVAASRPSGMSRKHILDMDTATHR
jgi:hypothetical protein